ncbi:fad binding domain protein [Moniliophthora roreri]|nr:fad binding domain protein [Moniliophthora roreri]
MILNSGILSALAAIFVRIPRSLPACRILPTDDAWPSSDVWDTFNHTIGGRLIKTVPIGSPCHDPTFNEEQCNMVRQNWRRPEFHQPNPSSIMDPIFLNKSCDPFDPRGTPCRVGAYVQYAANVSKPEHVVKTIEFAKEHNIRFVVKNTGHDYMGRSTGTGAVSVWMHHLNDIAWLPDFKSRGYMGPAFKAYAGVRGIDLVRAAAEKGFAIVSGECPTVGFAGGYIQGGGHSALSSFYGLAADQSLEFEVITTEGRFVTASPTENEDLYWALSGGGGGTYGIVWSVTVKAHASLPVTLAFLDFNSTGITPDDYWTAIRNYSATTPEFSDSRIWGFVSITNASFEVNPLFAVNKTSREVAALIQPIQQTLNNLGISFNLSIQTFDSYLEAYDAIPSFPSIEVANILIGSRFMPESIWQEESIFNEYLDAVRTITDTGTIVGDIVMKPSKEVAGFPSNAVHPAWRETVHLTELFL